MVRRGNQDVHITKIQLEENVDGLSRKKALIICNRFKKLTYGLRVETKARLLSVMEII